MNHWLQYDEFIDRVRDKHHNGFSGLITGVSDTQHSFQIGFDSGDIVLVAYRLLKGRAALGHIMRIERAKITEHPSSDITRFQTDLPPTSDILTRFTSQSSATETNLDEITIPEPKSNSPTPVSGVSDAKLKKVIEAAAVHQFGPIGAMVCEEQLTSISINKANFKTIMLRIAVDVGADESDTQAFVDSVTQ